MVKFSQWLWRKLLRGPRPQRSGCLDGDRFLFFRRGMEKPFKSIEEQISLMHRRGLSTDADTPGILMREGYYSIVNGYKDP